MRSSHCMLRSDGLRVLAQRGFTLIELMVTISVLAILLGIAVPSFKDVLLGSTLTSHANNLIAAINLARGEALKRNVSVTLCASSDGSTCAGSGGWEQGWIIKCKTTDHLSCDASGPDWIVVQRQQAAAAGLKITEASASRVVTFDPNGVGATPVTLTVCRATPSAGSQERVISVTATGRSYVSKTANGVCS